MDPRSLESVSVRPSCLPLVPVYPVSSMRRVIAYPCLLLLSAPLFCSLVPLPTVLPPLANSPADRCPR